MWYIFKKKYIYRYIFKKEKKWDQIANEDTASGFCAFFFLKKKKTNHILARSLLGTSFTPAAIDAARPWMGCHGDSVSALVRRPSRVSRSPRRATLKYINAGSPT